MKKDNKIIIKKIYGNLLFNIYIMSLIGKGINPNSEYAYNEEKNVKIEESKQDQEEINDYSLYAGSSKVIADILSQESNEQHLNAGVIKVLNEPLKMNIEKMEECENSEISKKVTPIVQYDFPCSQDFQNHIFKISDKYEVPFDVMMVILDQESAGTWAINGVESKTGDLGVAQINGNENNLYFIYEKLGYEKNDILYDPYKCVEAEAVILRYFMDYYGYTIDDFDYENLFGTYNGWINWTKNAKCWKYVNSCMQILEEKFGSITRKLN